MTSTPEWLTRAQAADLAGCPESTIQHHIRTGRIQRRTDRRPSLNRASVEAFATWWRDETTGRDQRRADRAVRRIVPPEPEGWIQTRDAATRLGYADADHIVYLIRQGRLEGRKVGSRWWVPAGQVAAYGAERDQWISWLRAADLVGCSHETIRRAVAAGHIEKRDVHRTQASLSLQSVLEFSRKSWGARFVSPTSRVPARSTGT